MEEYKQLRSKVDAAFEKLFQKHRSQINCTEGCHQCCAPRLTVSRVEADMISAYLQDHPEVVESLREIKAQNPHRGERCAMLNSEGMCSIYEVRPLICRSHGAPVLVQIDEKREGIDSCPLNFTEGMSSLEAGDWIHLETLNTMLVLIDWRYALDQGRTRPDPVADRVELSLQSLLHLGEDSSVGERVIPNEEGKP